MLMIAHIVLDERADVRSASTVGIRVIYRRTPRSFSPSLTLADEDMLWVPRAPRTSGGRSICVACHPMTEGAAVTASPFNAYVAVDSAAVSEKPDGSGRRFHLLWGDGVVFLDDGELNGRRKIRARGRGRQGWIKADDLEGGVPLLELYFIDVGQGDGVLIRTPDFRHVLIDAGHPRTKQNTRKNAADFVDWKFFHDYARDHIALDAVIASHNDEDHYGGLKDLLDPASYEGGRDFDTSGISVEAFYHAGLSWWVGPDGKRTLGTTADDASGRLCFTQLLADRSSAEAGTAAGAQPALQGTWREFIEKVVATRTGTGNPTPIARLHPGMAHLPGFEPTNPSRVTVHVLGPVDTQVGGEPALPVLGPINQAGKSTNGNSVLLRLDYGNARLLLTGDLNLAAHRLLLEHYAGREDELECDVAKACHHGSDDISYKFLEAMRAGATIISSGDGEGHDHPRPVIVAASGMTGYRQLDGDRIVTPLVYCTELARSVSMGDPKRLEVERDNATLKIEEPELDRALVSYVEQKPGDLRPRVRSRTMEGCSIVAGLVYGLVNVRTDGRTILAATMNEGKEGVWSIKKFKARF